MNVRHGLIAAFALSLALAPAASARHHAKHHSAGGSWDGRWAGAWGGNDPTAVIVKGGRVVGESDARGAFPRVNAKTPQDVLATLYQHLGVDPTEQYVNNAGRPIPVLPSGKAIEELF